MRDTGGVLSRGYRVGCPRVPKHGTMMADLGELPWTSGWMNNLGEEVAQRVEKAGSAGRKRWQCAAGLVCVCVCVAGWP